MREYVDRDSICPVRFPAGAWEDEIMGGNENDLPCHDMVYDVRGD